MNFATYAFSQPATDFINYEAVKANVTTGSRMSRGDVLYIVIHYTATREDSDYTAEQLISDHKKWGFYTGGYHFYVRRDGTTYQFRQLLEQGAHCKGSNSRSIGICFEGGLDSEGNVADTMTQTQYERIVELIGAMAPLFWNLQSVFGHRQMPSTSTLCPGIDAYKRFARLFSFQENYAEENEAFERLTYGQTLE